MHKLLATITAVLTISFATSYSQEFTPEIETIFRQVLAENGVLTEDMHTRFWAELNRGPADEAQAVANAFKKNVLITREYQREMWESARISFENRVIVRTDRMIELDSLLIEEFKDSLPWPEGSNDYVEALATYREERAASDANRERLLKAAAEHSSLVTATGQKMQIDEQQISLVLTNLNDSFARFSRLLDPVWK